MHVQLKKLQQVFPAARIQGNGEAVITGVTADSREVAPGALFICLFGHRTDGHDYILQAQQAGASAFLCAEGRTLPADIQALVVPDTAKAMQVLVPWLYGYPAGKLRMLGVTGTNGKTTTTHLIQHILETAGYSCGLLGTLHVKIGDKVLPVHNTTPDVTELQGFLAAMVEAKCEYAVMEVSSHALSLERVAGCEFDMGIFTNLTQDHLDFHGTLEKYLAAKQLLFSGLGISGSAKQGKHAVINRDDPAGIRMAEACSCPVTLYGTQGEGDLTARDIAITASGMEFTVAGGFGEMNLHLKLTGLFNVYNVLAAIGTTLAEGVEPAVIKQALEEFATVPGRFELVKGGQDFAVIVDYAHTPDSLENILVTARSFTKSRLITVFGCGGDRDKTKRPIMGSIAAKYSDHVILTSDNPRTEDPEQILRNVEAGLSRLTTSYKVIADRREAIREAVFQAREGDVVIIAGKGHEDYQILKDRTIHFDDREVVREYLKERL